MYLSERDLNSFLNNIASMFGNKCEIVVHDFRQDLEHTIVKIINGHVSNREVGACPTNLFFEKYSDLDKDIKDIPNYFNKDNQGHIVKSNSTFLHDENGNVIGAICINFDVTDLIKGDEFISELLDKKLEKAEIINDNNEVFHKSVAELMDYYLDKVKKDMGKNPEDMSKAEKIQALAYLKQRGILQIAKAHVKLCDFFGISTYTLYAYLDEIKRGDGE